jgi:hypothetical protein
MTVLEGIAAEDRGAEIVGRWPGAYHIHISAV